MKNSRYQFNAPEAESPVEALRKELPRGNGAWPGFSEVYTKMSDACLAMGLATYPRQELHVRSMAILGCGHEETMKYHLGLLRIYGWIK